MGELVTSSPVIPLLDKQQAANAAAGIESNSGQNNANNNHQGKKIGVMALSILIFYSVSGGPFGMEDAVRSAGPLITIIGMIALPLFWSLPEALICAELAPTFPEASGTVAWVEEAFDSPFLGFMKGYLSWTSGVIDNSLYPVLIVSYVFSFFKDEVDDVGMDDNDWDRLGLLFVITFVLTYLNYRGLDIVGEAVMIICLASLLPFVFMVAVGAFHVDVHRFTRLPEGGLANVHWNDFLNVVFWSLNYYDSCSSLAGDVVNPGESFPKAMMLAILLVMLSTALPLLIGIGATDFPDSKWQDGFFATIAECIVGKWLGVWVVLGSAISSIGMFESEMSTDSFQLSGMADRGLLPAVFAQRSRYGTPTLAILCSAAGVLCLGILSFLEIIELLNFLYVLAMMLEFAAFVKLRISRPDLHRPYRIPLNTFGVCLMLICPTLLLLSVLVMARPKTYYICFLLVVLGCLLYYLLTHSSVRARVKFLEPAQHTVTAQQGQEHEDLNYQRNLKYGSDDEYLATTRHSVSDKDESNTEDALSPLV